MLLPLIFVTTFQLFAQDLDKIEKRNNELKFFIKTNEIDLIIYQAKVISYNKISSKNRIYSDSIVYNFPNLYYRYAQYSDGQSMRALYNGDIYQQFMNNEPVPFPAKLASFENGDVFFQKLNLIQLNDSCQTSIIADTLICDCTFEDRQVRSKFTKSMKLISTETKHFFNENGNSLVRYTDYVSIEAYPEFTYPSKIYYESPIIRAELSNIRLNFMQKK